MYSNSEKSSKSTWLKQNKWLFIVPIIIAIAILLAFKKNASTPQRIEVQEKVTTVRTLEVPALDISPSVIGHGSVQPSKSWRVIAQVKGSIVYKSPELQKGAIIAQDTSLIHIDPSDYELNIAQIKADIAATTAQLDELTIKEKNTKALLALNLRSLDLSKKELERQKTLVKRGSVSSSDVEKQESNLLNQQQNVQNQRNTLALYPSQKALLQAQLQRNQAKLKLAERDLTNTQLSLPFTGRVAEVNAEQEQYIREGEQLARIDALDKAEIEVQLPLASFSSLLPANNTQALNLNAIQSNKQMVKERLGLKAQIILDEQGQYAKWQASFARISDTLDPKTRTVGIILEVDKPYADVIPGVKPPLVKGLFVKAKIYAQPIKNSLVIPNSAIRVSPALTEQGEGIQGDGIKNNKQSVVHIINSEGRLEIRPIRIKLRQEHYSLIETGLKQGDTLVLSQLIPATEGMRLKGISDPNALKQLQQHSNSTSLGGNSL